MLVTPPPHLTRNEIQRRADEFLKRYCQDRSTPIDIEGIIEALDIHIQPVPQLMHLSAGVDAIISSDFKVIYVDKEQYDHPQGAYDNRLRFSMAHELAHQRLHGGYYAGLEITTLDDVYRFFAHLSVDEYRWIEWQSNEFAGRALIPRDALTVVTREVLKRHSEELAGQSFGADVLSAVMAPEIGSHFGVSAEVIIRRLQIERIPDRFGSEFDDGRFVLNLKKLRNAEELQSDWVA